MCNKMINDLNLEEFEKIFCEKDNDLQEWKKYNSIPFNCLDEEKNTL